MPNWCSTTIIFHGNEEEINDFHKKIEGWISKPAKIPEYFGETWLGNILYGVGLEDRIDAAVDRLRCRGWITYFDDLENYDGDWQFKIDTETAWAPMLCMWEETIKKLEYKTIGFSFQSEEPGMCDYFMFDPYGDFEQECDGIKYEELERWNWL